MTILFDILTPQKAYVNLEPRHVDSIFEVNPMAISQKDNEFMQEVTEYFKSTITESNPNGSIRETALKFKITRTKGYKICV